jgi:hypothetical protein
MRMAMHNVKVEQADGTETYYQVDDSEETGKAILKALNDAVKDANNPTKSVAKGDPKPINR